MRNFIVIVAFTGLLLGAGCASEAPQTPAKVQNNTPASSEVITEPVVEQSVTSSVPTTSVSSTTIAPATSSPTVKPGVATSSPVSKGTVKSYTMAEVAAASSEKKCWSVINGKVYDLTTWAPQHPGGKPNILKLCGKDGSSFFNGKHKGQEQPEKTLAGFQIGTLKK